MIDVKDFEKTHPNSVTIEFTEGSILEVVSTPDDANEKFYLKLKTPHPVAKVIVVVEEIEK